MGQIVAKINFEGAFAGSACPNDIDVLEAMSRHWRNRTVLSAKIEDKKDREVFVSGPTKLVDPYEKSSLVDRLAVIELEGVVAVTMTREVEDDGEDRLGILKSMRTPQRI
ncbi:hypothetical protein FRC10_010033 [Ceratobasidium sp. 414]|nr:hypothetical protein FRC10_010033 [Ceratobasidium sp. 414]